MNRFFTTKENTKSKKVRKESIPFNPVSRGEIDWILEPVPARKALHLDNSQILFALFAVKSPIPTRFLLRVLRAFAVNRFFTGN
jgi:hypothetical protein